MIKLIALIFLMALYGCEQSRHESWDENCFVCAPFGECSFLNQSYFRDPKTKESILCKGHLDE